MALHPGERVLRPGSSREDACKDIVIEVYDGRANTESDPIDRFTAVSLGSFKLQMEDVLGQLDHGDSLQSVSTAIGLTESEGLQDCSCNEADEATECRRDGWFGGIARREGSKEPGLKVAVRLESWRSGKCGVDR